MASSAASILVEAFSLYGLEAVRLRSPHVDVVVLPGKGADVHSFFCRATGTEMLAQAFRAEAIAAEFIERGATGYGECFIGGWPSLLPSRARSQSRSLHPDECGEAATLQWESREIIVRGNKCLHCTVDLPRSRLRVLRTFGFDTTGRRLVARTAVTNLAEEAIAFHWTEHPTFGGDLLASDFELMLPACTVHDVESSGVPASSSERIRLTDGSMIDLRDVRLPAGGDLFRTLAAPAWRGAAIFNASRGVGCWLRWHDSNLPHAWYWQSNRDGQRMLAIEPSNSFGTELDDAIGEEPLRLQPGESMRSRMSLEVINAAEAAALRIELSPHQPAARQTEATS